MFDLLSPGVLHLKSVLANLCALAGGFDIAPFEFEGVVVASQALTFWRCRRKWPSGEPEHRTQLSWSEAVDSLKTGENKLRNHFC